MTCAQVDSALREYRQLIGRCGHIDAEIARLELGIRREKAAYERALAAPSVSRLTGMPRGGGTGSPTERAALTLAEGRAFWESEAGGRALRMQAQIDALRAEREERQLRARFVESWLSGLPERERWVIERHIIEGEIWHDIAPQFNARFMDDVSHDRLKRIQKKALEKIYAMAS